MRLANRIFASFLGIIVFSTLASSVTGALLISRAVQSEAIARVRNDLKASRSHIEDKLRTLEMSSQLLSKGLWGAVDMKDTLSIAFLADDEEAQVLAAAGIPLLSAASGFLLIPRQLIASHALASFRASSIVYPGERAMCLFSASPGPRGWAFCAIMLNGNDSIVGSIQEILFGSELYGNKPFGTVTIFQGSTRVATTVIGPSGEVAVGTEVSEEVRGRVLDKGETWLQRAYVVDDWYLSAYEPIQDPRSRTIGILYVGVLERKYIDIRARAMLVLAAVSIPSLLLLLAAAYFLARGIVRPMEGTRFFLWLPDGKPRARGAASDSGAVGAGGEL